MTDALLLYWQPADTTPAVAGWYERHSWTPGGRMTAVLRHYWNGSAWQAGRDWTGAFCPQEGFRWRPVTPKPPVYPASTPLSDYL